MFYSHAKPLPNLRYVKWILLKAGMGNGEWGMGNGDSQIENVKSWSVFIPEYLSL